MHARLIRHEAIPAPAGKVNDEGGELRVLNGADHGLQVSVMASRIVPGGGPRRHRHPHAEAFVVHAGRGRFEIAGELFDAEGGDMLIVPPNEWHVFVNTGALPLVLTAVHENRHATTIFEDGTRRD